MPIKNISVEDLSLMVTKRSDITIIDVRTPTEFKRGHIPGALNLHGEKLTSHVKGLDSSSVVAVVCQSGGRSQMACQALRRDVPGVVNVDGGTAAWIRAGLEVEKESKQMSENCQSSDASLRRQTHFVAAILLVSALIMGFTSNQNWFYVAYLPAFGLTLDALTGFCPMTFILRKAPWNSRLA
jgi:rhodanese-related sulfurtransferase